MVTIVSGLGKASGPLGVSGKHVLWCLKDQVWRLRSSQFSAKARGNDICYLYGGDCAEYNFRLNLLVHTAFAYSFVSEIFLAFLI